MTCPVCESNQINFLRNYNADHSTFKDIYLYKCFDCELVFALPMPNLVEIDQYNSSYFSSAHGGGHDDIYTKSFFEGMALIRIKYISERCNLDFLNTLRILEIGPGKGYLAREILKINSRTIYDVVETDSSCHKELKSIGVNVKFFFELDTYDLIIMSHVLEHTPCPQSFLSQYAKLLNYAGYLFLEVPCSDWVHKTKDEPHLLFFEKKSMQTLLSRVDRQIIDIGYYGKSIEHLQNNRIFGRILSKFKNILLRLRLTFLISFNIKNLDFLASDLQRIMISPHRAHIRLEKSAWWIRAVIRNKI